jgi:hypothetical protein
MSHPARRAVLAACVELLLVTAGCSGGADPRSTATVTGSSTDTTPPTDTTEPTDTIVQTDTTTPSGTWSPNATVDHYPPGVADNGTLANVTALVDAHVDATVDRPLEFTVEWTNPGESVVRHYARGAEPTPYYSAFERTSGGRQTTEQFYATGTRGYSRIDVDNETYDYVLQNTTHDVRAWTETGVLNPRSSLKRFLDRGNYSLSGTVERGGRTVVELTADEGTSVFGDSLTAFEGTVLVTPEGVVYEVGEAYADSEEHHEKSITVATDVEWSEPPSWVTDVPRLSLSILQDGQAVEIPNTGGAALPGNVSLRVDGRTEPLWGAPHPIVRTDANGVVTTDTRIEPGDAVYVTAGADGSSSSFALHDEPTRGEDTFGFAGIRADDENVLYWLLTGFNNTRNL